VDANEEKKGWILLPSRVDALESDVGSIARIQQTDKQTNKQTIVSTELCDRIVRLSPFAAK